jgi:competence protein ComEC
VDAFLLGGNVCVIGYVCYVAISAVLGIVTSFFHYSMYVVLAAFLYFVYSFLRHPRRIFVFCLVSFFVFCLYFHYTEVNNKSSLPVDTTQFQGEIVSEPVMNGDSLQFDYKIQDEKVRLVYKMKTEEEKERLAFLHKGMHAIVSGELREPPVARNEHAFDYKMYLHHQRIHYMLHATSFTYTEENRSVLSLLSKSRQQYLHYVREQFPSEAVGFVQALIFGERKELEENVEEWYEVLGLVHLLAISGSHITLIMLVCYWLLLRAGITRETATFLLLCILPIYMFMAGASPSVVRASITGMLVLVSFVVKKKGIALDLLAGTCMLMLLYNPYYVMDVGFLLSFSVSAGLVLSAHFVLLQKFSPLQSLLCMAIVSQCVALPITLYYFYEFSPYSILLNLLFVPFFSFVLLPLCVFSLVTSFLFAPLGNVLVTLLAFFIRASNYVLEVCSSLPFARLTFGKPELWWVILLYITVIMFFISVERNQRMLRQFAICATVSLLVFQYVPLQLELRVTFVDVGQGDCIIIELPKQAQVYVIDTGGTIAFEKEEWRIKNKPYDVGGDTVLPYLKSRGIKKIDKLILTHGDADHAGAADEVLQGIKVDELVVGVKKQHPTLEYKVIQLAQEKGIKVTYVQNGDVWGEEPYMFHVLAPNGMEEEENERSIVVYAVLGEYRWLFTGDLEREGEEMLLKNYPNLQVDVLKVGHHGSKTSTTEQLLNQLEPSIVVISAGERNRYQHPHEEVIERLEERRIKIFRTDRHGMINYSFVENRGTFSTKLPYHTNKE